MTSVILMRNIWTERRSLVSIDEWTFAVLETQGVPVTLGGGDDSPLRVSYRTLLRGTNVREYHGTELLRLETLDRWLPRLSNTSDIVQPGTNAVLDAIATFDRPPTRVLTAVCLIAAAHHPRTLLQLGLDLHNPLERFHSAGDITMADSCHHTGSDLEPPPNPARGYS